MSANSGFELKPLPRRVPKEIAARFERLASLQKDLLTPPSAPHRSRALADSALLQVTISYHLTDLPLDQWAGWNWKVEGDGDGSSHRVLHGMTNHAPANSSLSGSMLDGVRCWVPCLDPYAEEGESSMSDLGKAAAIFDLNITVLPHASAPIPYRVLSSGVLVSSSKIHPESDNDIATRVGYSYRFITPERTPLYAIGLFVGAVSESYSVPFYGCQGQIWLADSTLPDVPVVAKGSSSNGKSSSTISAIKNSPIENYVREVKHTFQGFDLALRYMHKALARRYTYHR
jgi:hypothetical protein